MKILILIPLLLLMFVGYATISHGVQTPSTETPTNKIGDDDDDYFAIYDKYDSLAKQTEFIKDNCKTPAQHKAFTSPDLQFSNLKGHVREVMDIEASLSDDWYTYYDLKGRFILANQCSEIPLYEDHFKRNSKGYITGIRDYICSGFCIVVWNEKHQVVKMKSKELTIVYTYDSKGLRTKEVHTSANGEVRTYSYSYKAFDSIGNWLERDVQYDDDKPYRERRKITYYTK